VLRIRIFSVVKGTADPRGDDIFAAIHVGRPVCNAKSGDEMLYKLPKLDTSERNIRGVITMGSIHADNEGT